MTYKFGSDSGNSAGIEVRSVVTPKPTLIPWASRAAGAIGMVTALLYLGLILGEGEPGQLPLALVFFMVMAGAGVVAWYADRVDVKTGRRMMWMSFVLFFVLGVLSIFTIGILFLIATVLSVFSLSRTRPMSHGDMPADARFDDQPGD